MNRWSTTLTVSPETLKYDLGKYIWASSTERNLYCFECESIDFQNREGDSIWDTKGSGEMRLPKDVGVYIVRGKWKVE